MAGKTDYKNQFAKEKYDRVGLMLPKGMKAELKAHADSKGDKSLNAFIMRAIALALKSDKGVTDTMGVGTVSYSKEYLQLIERKYDGEEDISEELRNFDKNKMFVDGDSEEYLSYDLVHSLANDFSFCLERSKYLLLDVFVDFCPNLSGYYDLLDEFDENFGEDYELENYHNNCM